jgi:hypothetical protein
MVQNIIWKANSHSAYQIYTALFVEPGGSSPCSQKPAPEAYPDPAEFSLGRAKESVQVRGPLKHFVTKEIFTVRGC